MVDHFLFNWRNAKAELWSASSLEGTTVTVLHSYFYSRHQKKFTISFNTIPFRFGRTRQNCNDNRAQRFKTALTVPFRVVPFHFCTRIFYTQSPSDWRRTFARRCIFGVQFFFLYASLRLICSLLSIFGFSPCCALRWKSTTKEQVSITSMCIYYMHVRTYVAKSPALFFGNRGGVAYAWWIVWVSCSLAPPSIKS